MKHMQTNQRIRSLGTYNKGKICATYSHPDMIKNYENRFSTENIKWASGTSLYAVYPHQSRPNRKTSTRHSPLFLLTANNKKIIHSACRRWSRNCAKSYKLYPTPKASFPQKKKTKIKTKNKDYQHIAWVNKRIKLNKLSQNYSKIKTKIPHTWKI